MLNVIKHSLLFTLRESRGYPYLRRLCTQAHAKARNRWLLLHSSIRHSPLDALDLPDDAGSNEGHPRLSLD